MQRFTNAQAALDDFRNWLNGSSILRNSRMRSGLWRRKRNSGASISVAPNLSQQRRQYLRGPGN
jgi:hypothetical protein